MSENILSDEAIAFIKECYVKLNQSGNGVWAFADLSQSFWLPKLQSKNKQVFFNIIHDAIAYGLIGLSNLEDFADLNSDFLNFYNGFISQINKSQGYSEFLEKRVDELENRFGLVWKEQEEQFLKIISEKEIVLGTGLFLLDEEYIFDSETKDKKNKIIKDKNGKKITLKRKRGDSFLYYSKELSCLFLLYSVNSKVNVYRFKENNYLEYYPILKEKGDGFGFGEVRDNLLIEGDNYYALQLLQFTHKGKVDVIYIDPPYNTGNGDFKYNDAFVGSDDGSRHSKWLSFMKKRLLLAKSLLNKNGSIFISIDDFEVAYLKVLCDSMFQDFQSVVFIQEKGNAQNDAKIAQKNHEYIVCYTRKTNFTQFEKEEIKVYSDNNGFYIKTGMAMGGGEGGTINGRPNLGYTIYFNEKTLEIIPVNDVVVEKVKVSNDYDEVYKNRDDLIDSGFIPIRPPLNGNKIGCWKWGIDKISNNLEKIIISKVKNKFSVYRKDYKYGVMKNNGKMECDKESTPKSIINISNNKGTMVLKEIFSGDKIFNNPKSVDLIKCLLSFVSNKEGEFILDFFAGSGTTGQAVLELNKEDGGNRKYILCTNNENNICEDVTYERMKRISNPKEYGIDMEPLEHGLKYIQIKHQSKLDFEVADELGNFEAIKHINDVKFSATKVITDNKSTYITDTYAVFKEMNNRVSKKSICDFIQTAIKNNIFNIVCLCNGNRNYEKFKDFVDDYFQENIHLNKFNYKIHHMSQDYINQMFTVISGEEVIDVDNHISFKDDCEGEN